MLVVQSLLAVGNRIIYCIYPRFKEWLILVYEDALKSLKNVAYYSMAVTQSMRERVRLGRELHLLLRYLSFIVTHILDERVYLRSILKARLSILMLLFKGSNG